MSFQQMQEFRISRRNGCMQLQRYFCSSCIRCITDRQHLILGRKQSKTATSLDADKATVVIACTETQQSLMLELQMQVKYNSANCSSESCEHKGQEACCRDIAAMLTRKELLGRCSLGNGPRSKFC